MTTIRTNIPSPPSRPNPGKVGSASSKGHSPAGIVSDEHRPPPKRGFQRIPAPEVLTLLIDRAVEALKHGIIWDRGSILNIEA